MSFNFSNVYRFEKIFCLNGNVVSNKLVSFNFSNLYTFENVNAINLIGLIFSNVYRFNF